MLDEYAVWLLVLMAHVYLGGAVICAWALIKCASKKRKSQAIISFMSAVAITITSLLCALPFLKMHGSYSDEEKIQILALVAANIALIIFISISRIRVILGIDAELASLAKRTDYDQSSLIILSERGGKHRRIIGYIWLIAGAAGFALSSYSVMKRLSTSMNPEMVLGLIPGVTVSLLFLFGGYSLLRSLAWSRWLCLPISVLAFLAFPIGTALGGYYLWYYLNIERQILNKVTGA